MKAYAPYHQLYAISVIFCEINKMNDSVPSPFMVLEKMEIAGLLDTIVDTAGSCLNMAFETASSEATENGKMFVPQNWIKSKASFIPLCIQSTKKNIQCLHIFRRIFATEQLIEIFIKYFCFAIRKIRKW